MEEKRYPGPGGGNPGALPSPGPSAPRDLEAGGLLWAAGGLAGRHQFPAPSRFQLGQRGPWRSGKDRGRVRVKPKSPPTVRLWRGGAHGLASSGPVPEVCLQPRGGAGMGAGMGRLVTREEVQGHRTQGCSSPGAESPSSPTPSTRDNQAFLIKLPVSFMRPSQVPIPQCP